MLRMLKTVTTTSCSCLLGFSRSIFTFTCFHATTILDGGALKLESEGGLLFTDKGGFCSVYTWPCYTSFLIPATRCMFSLEGLFVRDDKVSFLFLCGKRRIFAIRPPTLLTPREIRFWLKCFHRCLVFYAGKCVWKHPVNILINYIKC